MIGLPGMRLGAHYDLFKNGPDGRPEVLIATSRRCQPCGQPLLGSITKINHEEVHVACARHLHVEESEHGKTIQT